MRIQEFFFPLHTADAYANVPNCDVQSFAQFRMGVLFEVITRWMVPQEMKFWYDYKI